MMRGLLKAALLLAPALAAALVLPGPPNVDIDHELSHLYPFSGIYMFHEYMKGKRGLIDVLQNILSN